MLYIMFNTLWVFTILGDVFMKKKILLILLSLALASCCIFGLTACKHEHAFGAWQEEISATCTADGVKAHKTCTGCNEHFDEQGNKLSDIVIPKDAHSFNELIPEVPASCMADGVKEHKTCSVCQKNFDADGVEIEKLAIIKFAHKFGEWHPQVDATCYSDGVKGYRYCSRCELNYDIKGKIIEDLVIPATPHVLTTSYPSYETLATPATATEKATFYKTCLKCLQKSEETYTADVKDKKFYEATSISLSLFDTQTLKYGINFNTVEKPFSSIIELTEKDTQNTVIVSFSAEIFSSYNADSDVKIYRYKNYAEIQVVAGKTYVYCIKDLAANTCTEDFQFTALNPDKTSFKFSHVSDTQMTLNSGDINTGAAFNKVLSNMANVDFIVHSGDLVEESKYEQEWDYLFSSNRSYFAQKPVMAVAGNHDTTYKSGDGFELHKHFHYNVPEQNVQYGAFYSFDYGNVRFIQVNTNRLTSNKLTQDQLAWITGLLDNNPNKWTIITMHNPLYSVGQWGTTRGEIASALQRQLTQLFVDKGVDLVLQGHDHIAQRTYAITGFNDTDSTTIVNKNVATETIGGIDYKVNPNGTYYMMSGASGNQGKPTYTNEYLEKISGSGSSSTYSWSEIEVSENTLTITTKSCYGQATYKILDSWGIKKTA